ncbi:hypothetical protein C7T96_10570 [Nitratireductor sp. StC3]|nr:hypothetical protein C7T96_10570 [Nitratireductor sp. StC3]
MRLRPWSPSCGKALRVARGAKGVDGWKHSFCHFPQHEDTWLDLAERYGKWKTVHKHFKRWSEARVSDEASPASLTITTTIMSV